MLPRSPIPGAAAPPGPTRALRSSAAAADVAPIHSPAARAWLEARLRDTSAPGASTSAPAQDPDQTGPAAHAQTGATARALGTAFRRDAAPDGAAVTRFTRQVEIQRRPMWSSLSVAATREFLRLEQQYQILAQAQGLPHIPLHELVDGRLLPALPGFVDDVLGEDTVLSPVEDIVSVDSADEWERTLREAIEYYLNEPKLLVNVSLDDMMQHLAAEVWWDLSLPTLVEARATFKAQFDSCLHAHSMREELFKSRKIEKRVVTFLVGLLRPISWRRHVMGQLERLDINTVSAFFSYLKEEDKGYLAFRSASSVPASQFRVARSHGHGLMSASGGGAGAGGPGSARLPPSPCSRCGGPHWNRDCTRPSGPGAPPVARPPRFAPPAVPPARAYVPLAARPAPNPCMHCGGPHWNRDCPSAPRSGGASGSPPRPYRAPPGPAPRGGTPGYRARRCHPDAVSDGVLAVNANVMVPFCLDTGCLVSYISPQHAELLRAAAPASVAVVPLATPIVIDTPIPGSTMTATSQLVFSAPSTLRSRSGDEHLVTPVLYISVGMDNREVLLGRDVYGALSQAFRDSILLPEPTINVSTDNAWSDLPVLLDAATHTQRTRALHATPPEAPDEYDVDGGVDVGAVDPDEVRAALERALSAASAQGMSDYNVNRLRVAVMGPLFDCFRTQLGPDPPADVPPVRMEFEPDSTFPRQAPRRYSQEASVFINEQMATLERYGYVVKDNFATIASPAYPVRKAGADPNSAPNKRLRLTIDLRHVNKKTRRHLQPLPRPETFVERLGGYRFLGKVDLHGAYWQLPLHEDSQRFFCIMTDQGIWRSNRVLQGGVNGSGPMQSAMYDTLGPLCHTACEIFQDDIAVKAKTEDELVDNFINVLTALHVRRFKVNANKVTFYEARILFVGRVFTADGVHFNPDFINTVANMPCPSSASDLQQFLATANWMRQAVGRYAELVAPLQAILTAALRVVPGASKAARARLCLRDHGWTSTHDDCVARIKSAIVQATMLSYPRPDYAVCVFTDASDLYWSGIVTQCLPSELEKPILDQQHLPLAFFSGPFQGAALRYAMVEKEGLAMVATCTKASYLLHRTGPVHLFTDHRNNVALYSQDPAVLASSRPAADRISRWQSYMRSFNFTIHAISTTDNVASDIFTRWAATPLSPDAPADGPPPLLRMSVRRVATRSAVQAAAVPAAPLPTGAGAGAGGAPAPAMVVPAVLAVAVPVAAAVPDPTVDSPFSPSSILDFDVHDAPSESEILAAQAAAGPVPPGVTVQPDGTWTSPSGALYVCDTRHLRLRLCIVAHQGSACHRGALTTLYCLRHYFWWPSMVDDVALFVSNCLHCIRIRTGKVVPRPLLSTAHATGPNQMLAFDFLYIRPVPASGAHNYSYVLTITDTYSKFCDLVPCSACDTASVVQALLRWFSLFGIVKYWCSDSATHFKNRVMAALCGLLGGDHHFTAPYASWSNGRVERLQHVVLLGLKALCVSACLSEDDWPSWLPLVVSTINHSPSATLGGLCPVTVHTGLPPTNPLAVIFLPDARDLVNVAPSVADIRAHTESVASELHAFHDRVDAVRPRTRPPQRGEVPVDFEIGSYVLVAKHGPSARDKLRPIWSGPARVVDAPSPLVFTVEDLITSARTDVHAAFIKSYADSQLVVSPQLLAFVAHCGRGYIVESIIDHKILPAQLLVRWEGFSEPTWEPLATVFHDTPVSVRLYARTLDDPAQRLLLLGLLRDLAA